MKTESVEVILILMENHLRVYDIFNFLKLGKG